MESKGKDALVLNVAVQNTFLPPSVPISPVGLLLFNKRRIFSLYNKTEKLD